MREKRKILEHQADIALLRRNEMPGSRHFLIVDENAARLGALDPSSDTQKRRLAAARGSEKADDLAWRQIEADLAYGR